MIRYLVDFYLVFVGYLCVMRMIVQLYQYGMFDYVVYNYVYFLQLIVLGSSFF